MKKIEISIFVSLLFISGSFANKNIVVSNPLNMDRKAEIVEINLSALKISTESKSWILKDSSGIEVGYQLIKNENKKVVSLIFQADVKAGSSAIYTLIDGKPAPVKAKTFGRFVPERKDDFAWENDLAAYRMYGPALAKQNPSNGVDLWLKCTDELVVNKRYYDELTNGLSYHIDHGDGLDCYSVGHTLGVGGIAPYAHGKLWIGNHFDRYKVIQNGPIRTVFMLTYDSVKVGNEFFKQTITITADAGSLLNKAVVKYTGHNQNMELAAGIFLHDGKGILNQDIVKGTMTYSEDAVSTPNVAYGRNYVGVLIPSKVKAAKNEVDHAIILGSYRVGASFLYYFGGGWSKWCYSSDEKWVTAVSLFAEKIKYPLKINLR